MRLLLTNIINLITKRNTDKSQLFEPQIVENSLNGEVVKI